jgi:hypothetical protein
VTVDSSAVVHRTAVWDGVIVGARARIDECILCDGVSIPAGSRYTRCAIVPHDGSPPREGERVDGALLVHPF